MNNIKWATFCGANEAISMRQHCFKEITVKNPYGEEHYLGNKSLCGKISAYEDSILPLSEIEAEKKVDWCCKTCDRIFKINQK